MRLFVAIELGDAVRTRAASLVDDLRRRAERQTPHARLTWVAPERMHLTLRFIGETAQEKAGDVIAALRAPLAMRPFVVRWEGLGAFPPRGAPRVLWVGVARGLDRLREAESLVSARLEAVGLAREARPYNPHLTLARVREPAGLKPASLFEGHPGHLGDTRVGAITLFQSHLSPKGPAYTALQRTPLDRSS
jgi:2'-5' RNA ligase